jgi:hypothetical protein
MDDGVKFCPSCGTQAGGGVVSAPKPAMEKVGNIRKCPACGAEVPAMTAVCPSCGHEFSNVKVASSVQTFFEKLDTVYSDKEKISLIKSFPVPNAKEDLLEFIIMASSRIEHINTAQTIGVSYLRACTLGIWKGPIVNQYNIAWRNKLKECYTKAKIALSGNKDSFAQVEQIMSEVVSAEQKASKRLKIAVLSIIVFYVAFFVVMFTVPTYLINKPLKAETQRLEAIAAEVTTAIEKGDFDSARLKATQIIWEYERGGTEMLGIKVDGPYAAEEKLWDAKREALLLEIETRQGKE